MVRNSKTFANGAWRHPNVSPLAAVYGGNASGKSNFLRCLRFFSNFVANSFRRGDSASSTGLIPFLLDNESEERQATYFAEFIAGDDNRYQYWFSLTQSRIEEEVLWLYKSATNRRTVLFERATGKPTRFGTTMGSNGRFVEKITRENALLLSAAAASGINAVQPAYDEITKTFIGHGSVNFNDQLGPMVHVLQQNPALAKNIADLVKYADLGITEVDFREENIPAEQEKKLLSFASALGAISGDNTENDAAMATDQPAQSSHFRIPHISFSHSGHEITKQFSEQWESDGTKNAMLLFLWVIQSLMEPSVMLIDEIETSLSTKLLSDILRLYRDPYTNPHQSQLIFTTHDLSLINAAGADQRLLDRDQIWFVVKNSGGESSLHPLTEWESRNVNFAKNYQHDVYVQTPQPSLHETVARICQESAIGESDYARAATSDNRK
jgi:AAA15 family ATPase/GTPase